MGITKVKGIETGVDERTLLYINSFNGYIFHATPGGGGGGGGPQPWPRAVGEGWMGNNRSRSEMGNITHLGPLGLLDCRVYNPLVTLPISRYILINIRWCYNC